MIKVLLYLLLFFIVGPMMVNLALITTIATYHDVKRWWRSR